MLSPERSPGASKWLVPSKVGFSHPCLWAGSGAVASSSVQILTCPPPHRGGDHFSIHCQEPFLGPYLHGDLHQRFPNTEQGTPALESTGCSFLGSLPFDILIRFALWPGWEPRYRYQRLRVRERHNYFFYSQSGELSSGEDCPCFFLTLQITTFSGMLETPRKGKGARGR